MRATREGKAHLGRPNEREDMGLLGEREFSEEVRLPSSMHTCESDEAE